MRARFRSVVLQIKTIILLVVGCSGIGTLLHNQYIIVYQLCIVKKSGGGGNERIGNIKTKANIVLFVYEYHSG